MAKSEKQVGKAMEAADALQGTLEDLRKALKGFNPEDMSGPHSLACCLLTLRSEVIEALEQIDNAVGYDDVDI